MKPDTADRRLVFLLDQNGRASLTELAKQLKLSREAVNYRMRRLEEADILRGYVAKINFDAAGLTNYIVFLRLNNLDAERYAKFLEELVNKKSVTWTASLGGRYDLAIETASPDIAAFDSNFSEILDAHADMIGDCHVSTRIVQHTFGKKYLWPERTAASRKKPLPIGEIKMDDLDKKIISVLAQEARIPVVELASRIKQPPSTVSFRLRQLEKNGVIEGYTTFSRMQEFGYVRYKALITVRNFSREQEEKLFAFCQAHPNVYYYTKTLGNWNFEIEVDVQTSQQYQQFLIDFRTRFSNVIQDVESLSLFEEHKFSFWPW